MPLIILYQKSSESSGGICPVSVISTDYFGGGFVSIEKLLFAEGK